MRSRKSRHDNWSSSIKPDAAAKYGIELPKLDSAERFLSPNQIGTLLNLTGEAVKQWIYQRRLPAVKLANGYWKVRASDLEAFLKAKFDVGRRRVLIIGQTQDEMKDVAAAVTALGHTPMTANFSLDALLKLNSNSVALVILDCSPKNSDAWKFINKLRNARLINKIPILLIADTELSDEDSQKAIEAAARGFLKRPLESGALEREIAHVLNP